MGEDDGEVMRNSVGHGREPLFLGDALDMLTELPDACVDLVLSSPPHDVDKAYEGLSTGSGQVDDHQIAVLTQCVRALRPTGSLFWQVGTITTKAGDVIPLDVRLFPIIESLGLHPRGRIAWIRNHGLHARRRFSGRHESVL